MREKFGLDKKFDYCTLKKSKSINQITKLVQQFNSNQTKCKYFKYEKIDSKTLMAFCTKINKSCKYSNCPNINQR